MPRRPRTEAEKSILARRITPDPGMAPPHPRRAKRRYATNEKRRTARAR